MALADIPPLTRPLYHPPYRRVFTPTGGAEPAELVRWILVTQLPQQPRTSAEMHQREPDAVLQEHLAKLSRDLEIRHQERYDERLDALDRLIDTKLAMLRTVIDAQAEKVVIALAAADKALSKAETATEKRFDSVNEFRATLSDQTKTFVSRIEFDSLREVNTTRIVDLSSRLDKSEGKAVGLNSGWIYLLGALSALGTLVSIVVVVLTQLN